MVKLKKNNCKVILALFFLIAQIIIYNNNPLKTIINNYRYFNKLSIIF